jgi:hypothetical protein
LAPLINYLVYENGRVFYLKIVPSENVGKLYYREGLRGALLNPARFNDKE